MRSSNHQKILEAALRVIQRDGITALTFDSVAAESGVTRGGIIYHFKSRDDLIESIHRHVADQWESNLTHELGEASIEEADPVARLVAYIRTSAQSASRADLQLILETACRPDPAMPWQRLYEQWTPVPDLDDDIGLTRFLARLAADGLWLYEAIAQRTLTAQQREVVIGAIIDSVDALPGSASDHA